MGNWFSYNIYDDAVYKVDNAFQWSPSGLDAIARHDPDIWKKLHDYTVQLLKYNKQGDTVQTIAFAHLLLSHLIVLHEMHGMKKKEKENSEDSHDVGLDLPLHTLQTLEHAITVGSMSKTHTGICEWFQTVFATLPPPDSK